MRVKRPQDPAQARGNAKGVDDDLHVKLELLLLLHHFVDVRVKGVAVHAEHRSEKQKNNDHEDGVGSAKAVPSVREKREQ